MPDGLEKDSQVLSVDDTDFSDNSFDESGMHDDFQQVCPCNLWQLMHIYMFNTLSGVQTIIFFIWFY